MPAIVRAQKNSLPTLGYFAGFLSISLEFGTWTSSIHMIMEFISNQLLSNPFIEFWCYNISSFAHTDYLLTSSPSLAKHYDSLVETVQTIINRWHGHCHVKTTLVNSFAAFKLSW